MPFAFSSGLRGRATTAMSIAPSASALMPPGVPMLGSTSTRIPGSIAVRLAPTSRSAASAMPVPPMRTTVPSANAGCAAAHSISIAAASLRSEREESQR